MLKTAYRGIDLALLLSISPTSAAAENIMVARQDALLEPTCYFECYTLSLTLYSKIYILQAIKRILVCKALLF